MFANLLCLIAGRPASPDVARAPFVEQVHVAFREPRDLRLERVILICWILIALKHLLVIWVCQMYPVPFHQLWINFPTWLLGTLATGVYFQHVSRN